MSRFSRLFPLFALTATLCTVASADGQEAHTRKTTSPQAHSQQHGAPMPDKSSFTVTAESGVPEIPFKLINNHLILPIRVNGAGTVNAVLDTGMPTPGLVLFEGPGTGDLELNFDPHAAAQVAGAGGEGSPLMARMAFDVPLELDGLAMEGSQVIAVPESAGFGGYHNAIIGYSLFERFVVELDYDQGLMRLHEPGSYQPPQDALILPMTLRHGMPFVTVRVTPDGKEPFDTEVVVDLGASHAISLNTGWSEQITVPKTSLRTVLGHGLSGPVEGAVGRLAALEIAGARLTNVLSSFPVGEHQHPGGMDSKGGNLGSGILRRFTTTFDYTEKRVILVPNDSFAEPFEWDGSGLKLMAGRELKVESITPGSPGEESGVLVGDIVTHVDGEAVTAADYGKVREALMGPGEVRLTLERGEKSLEKTVSLRRMI